MIKIHTLVVGQLQTNCYILQSGWQAIVVDPGDEPKRILHFLKDLSVKPDKIIATHTHFDHVLGVNEIRAELKIPFLIHRDDLPMLQSMQSLVQQMMRLIVPPPPRVDSFLNDGETFQVGEEKVKVIHTPGHSAGSVSLSGDGFVLTGDALFNQSIGRTDLPGGDFDRLIGSIRNRLFKLDDDVVVYPGHGPETSIGDERLTNPFVGQTTRHVSKRLGLSTSCDP